MIEKIDDHIIDHEILAVKNVQENDARYIKTESDPLSLHLNQTTPQSVINGAPTFAAGLNVTGTMAATTVTGINVTSGSNPGHTHTTTETDPLSLHLDQTTPQTVTAGAPTFGAGLNVTGTMAATTVTGANVTSGVDPGHTHSGGVVASSYGGIYQVFASDVLTVALGRILYTSRVILTEGILNISGILEVN